MDSVIVFVPGTVYWAKVIGAPRDNYERTGREWSYDFVPDDVDFLKEAKLLDRLKEPKGDIEKDFIHLKKPEFNKEGEKNEPIRIYGKDNEEWDGRLLGNGTRVVAKLKVIDWGRGKKKSIWTQAIRVEELVAYTSSEFGAYDGPVKEAKKPKKEKAVAQELDALDDSLPF